MSRNTSELHSRHYARREPRPLSSLSRVHLAGRLAVTEQALGLLLDQAAQDGGEAPQALGAMKVMAIDLRNRIRVLDGQAPAIPFAAAVNVPGAGDRLRRLQGELAEVRAELEADQIRSNQRARRQAASEAETAETQLLDEARRVPDEDLLALAPSMAREPQTHRGEQ